MLLHRVSRTLQLAIDWMRAVDGALVARCIRPAYRSEVIHVRMELFQSF